MVAADQVSRWTLRVRFCCITSGRVAERNQDFSDGKSMKRKPKAVDLFCGAGGLTEGLRQGGYNVIGAVELDALACRTYRLNHKRVKLWEMDIARLPAATMMKALKLLPGQLDLLAACPP